MKRMKRAEALSIIWLVLLFPVWCGAQSSGFILLSTTTSTQDSGLLDVLNPIFEKKTGYFVKTIAVGSGQAMAMGQKGRPMCCWFTLLRRRRSSWPKDTGSTGG